MRRELVNEVEERRVMRLLSNLADLIPGLEDDDLFRFMNPSVADVRGRRARWFRSPPRYLSAVAAAAVVAIGVSAQLHRPAPNPSFGTESGAAEIFTFPEGTALQLLLTAEKRGKA